LESSGRLEVWYAGLANDGHLAAVQDPTDATQWHVAQLWPNSVVQIWKNDPADMRIKVVGFFFPNPLTPMQWLKFLAGDFI